MSTRNQASQAETPKRAAAAPVRFNKRYFQGIIAERGKTQREVAAAMELDPSALSLIFSAQRKLQLDEAAELARLLDLPLTEVFKNAGIEPPKTHAVALRGWIDAQGETHFFSERGGGLVDCPIELPEGAMAFQARTAMSKLEHWDGWLFFVPPPVVAGAGSKEADAVSGAMNRLTIAKLMNGGAVLGYLKKGYTRGRYSLYLGDQVVQDAQLEWAVPVKLAMAVE